MDIHLGDMNGYEATTEIRKVFDRNTTKVLAVTALLERFVLHKLEPAGLDGVLYKPLNKSKILKMMMENNIFNGKNH